MSSIAIVILLIACSFFVASSSVAAADPAPQGAEVLVALINLSADAAVARLAGPLWSEVAEVERLTPEGMWMPLPAKQEIAVAAWDVTVVRGVRG